jgi:RNA polymerase sigma-70 factor (ECF subfamily)
MREGRALLSGDDRAWIAALRGPAGPRERALSELHSLLLRAARFELSRRRGQLQHLSAPDIDDLGMQAADDALMAILGKLDGFRGMSRFTTWAYKFALLEAGVKARRRAWEGREIAVDEETWPEFADARRSAHECLEDAELLRALRDGVRSSLTPHQREVFSALALNGIPIDVLAERLNATRGPSTRHCTTPGASSEPPLRSPDTALAQISLGGRHDQARRPGRAAGAAARAPGARGQLRGVL